MENPIPFGGLLTREAVSTQEMRELWTEGAMLDTWLRVERVVLQEQIALDMIPSGPGVKLLEALDAIQIQPDQVLVRKGEVGHLMVAFLKTLRHLCGESAEHLHVGPTTQDIMDTGMVLQMNPAHDLIQKQSADLCLILCDRAEEYRETVVMGRTHQQPALPTSFGLVLAGWALCVQDHRVRLNEARRRWLIGSLSGGVGTQSAFVELADPLNARELERRMCIQLGLAVPPMDLQERFDRFSEPVTLLAGISSSLAKMAMDLVHGMQVEVDEIAVNLNREEHSSSTMPHKQNPESLEHLAGLASLVQGYAHAMLSVRQTGHRDATRIPVLWTALPGAYLMTSRALANLNKAMDRLVIHPEAMRGNVFNPRLLDQVATERIMIALYRKTGKKMLIHQKLHDLCTMARDQNLSLKTLANQEPDLRSPFTEREWDDLFDISTYLGTAPMQVDDVVKRLRREIFDEEGQANSSLQD